MSSQKISLDPTATDLTGTVYVPIVQNGTNKKADPSLFGGNKDLSQVLSIGNDGGGRQIKNIADPTQNQDAVTLAYFNASPLADGTYSTVLDFSTDKDIYHDATGASITFTLASGGIAGKGIILRLNKPTAVTFPGTFEADQSSSAVDSTKLNVFTLVFFTNWNGSGLDHVIYKNSLFASL